MRTVALLYLYIPTIKKLQIFSRSRNATKQRRYLWKISLLSLSTKAEERRNFHCSWRSPGERDTEQSLVWTKQQSWATLFPQPSLESRSGQPELHSQLSTGHCIKWIKAMVFLRKLGELIFLKEPWLSSWVTKQLMFSGRQERSQKKKEPGFSGTCTAVGIKGKTNQDENKIQVPQTC